MLTLHKKNLHLDSTTLSCHAETLLVVFAGPLTQSLWTNHTPIQRSVQTCTFCGRQSMPSLFAEDEIKCCHQVF